LFYGFNDNLRPLNGCKEKFRIGIKILNGK